jgi:tetratricopeptide (TPR) repeat protein
MSDKSRRPLIVAAVAVLVCGVISVRLQALRDSIPLATTDAEELYLTERASGQAVFTLRSLAADLYWIRAVQYFGGRAQIARQRQADPFEPPPSIAAAPPVSFDQLFPLLDITTTLDPRFNIAYRFGAIFLAGKYPEGPGRPELAVQLLVKGLKTSPQKWQYWHDIGFVYYWNAHDYRKASEAFQRAADMPGAPWWLRSLAATMLARGGDRETSRLLWRQLYESGENEYAKTAAHTKLMQLDAIEQIEQLQALVDRAAERSGEPVTSWQTLAAMGVARGVPVDPTGTPYALSPTGRVTLSQRSALLPLPVEPGAGTRQ